MTRKVLGAILLALLGICHSARAELATRLDLLQGARDEERRRQAHQHDVPERGDVQPVSSG